MVNLKKKTIINNKTRPKRGIKKERERKRRGNAKRNVLKTVWKKGITNG